MLTDKYIKNKFFDDYNTRTIIYNINEYSYFFCSLSIFYSLSISN